MKHIKDPGQLVTAKKEDLIELWENTLNEIDELLAQKETIKQEFEARIAAKEMSDSEEVAGYIITRFPKVYANKVTLGEAQKHGATVLKEIVNTTLLTKIIKAGTKVEGSEIRYEIRVVKQKQAEDTE